MSDQFKPKLRKEACIDLESAIRGTIWAMLNRNDIFPFQSCINCSYFREKTEICSYYNTRPPARVICFGCPQYDDKDEIPF